jgi:hypothetical protein
MLSNYHFQKSAGKTRRYFNLPYTLPSSQLKYKTPSFQKNHLQTSTETWSRQHDRVNPI